MKREKEETEKERMKWAFHNEGKQAKKKVIPFLLLKD